ncbi:MAG: SDR family oxidoreductase [Pseudomonadota bacterium]
MLNPHIDLSGQTAIVTGASRGIGEAIAKRLAQAGANVVLLARSAKAIEDIASALGEQCMAIACDVAHWPSVEQAVEQVAERFGRIDLLVNNAGIIEPIARIEDATAEGWGRAIDVNLKGVFHCTRAVLPHMKRGGVGTIVNISSGAATSALEGWSHYSSTKAAALMFTRCVHQEEAENGIRCVGLSPGTVATEFQRQIKAAGINPVSKLDWSAHIPPEWAAEAVAWLTTNEASVHDGGDFSIKTDEGRAAVGLPSL